MTTEAKGVDVVAVKPAPITFSTRWKDAKGRTWRVIENMHFGRYNCVLEDRPSYSGWWTAKEIRAAISRLHPEGAAKSQGATVGGAA
jgi:hypothetical protein